MVGVAVFRQIFLTLHLIGLALGLGGAAIADVTFFKAVKAGDRVTAETVTWMRSFSLIVWVGIGVLTVSGSALFLTKPSFYMHSAGFMAKMIFVSILVINGMFLNFYTTARLTTFNFSAKYQRRDAAWRIRKLSFIFGAISTVSWYSALITAQFKTFVAFSFYQYIVLYGAALVLAIVLSLILEYFLHQRHLKPAIANLTVSVPVKLDPIMKQPAVQPRPIVLAESVVPVSIIPKNESISHGIATDTNLQQRTNVSQQSQTAPNPQPPLVN